MTPKLAVEELRALDAEVCRALETGELGALRVLGYGEISSVVGWSSGAGPVACKVLPPFRGEDEVLAYAALVDQYLDELAEHGVRPVETAVQWLRRPTGEVIAYCLQPLLDGDTLLTYRLARSTEAEARSLFNRVSHAVRTSVSPRLGLDGQASNWVVLEDGALGYLDVSTPLLRDEAGREQLDTAIFLSSLPRSMRPAVRRVALKGILDKYYDPRGVILDFLGNLQKEGVRELLSPLLRVANGWVSPPLSEEEVRRYYRADASTWELLQRLRRLDRGWHRLRGRVYPFLLPGKIERNV